ncbi:putative Ig domain-containing protein [Micromonospora sp. NBC_01813]|uniref:putative Ig domain-containing protein n=1 Tax=Micromonospora sp. NBC_01813 TaxID=2975988 RepID=UPI002DDB7B94|nr:putative Ig domain-containing protein [Micromonospora sp. NBC_01813]WSA11384.1 putative Ig domain-containing protein [Micromonospora sp. NBC_01813]
MSPTYRLRALAASAIAGALIASTFVAPAAAAPRTPSQPGTQAPSASQSASQLALAATPAEPTTPAAAAKDKQAKPDAPAAPRVAKKDTTAVVTWKAPKDNGSKITEYVITKYHNGKKKAVRTFDATKTSRKLTLPAADGTWTFTVAARNTAGVGPASKRSAPPQLLALPSAPTIIAATADVSTAVVSWLPPASDGGSPIVNYIVFPYLGAVQQPSQTVFSTPTTAVIGALTPGLTYTFTIAALTAEGLGPESAPSHPVIPNESAWVTWTGPSAEIGVAYSHTVGISRGISPWTFSTTYGALPPGLTLSPTTGNISGIPTTPGTYAFVLRAVDSLGHIGSRLITLTVTPPPNIVIASVPLAEVNAPYSLRPTVVGGLAPYVWSISSGILPPGLTLNPATGEISGRPTTAGTYSFGLRVTDAAGLTDTEPVRIVVQQETVVILSSNVSSVYFDHEITFTIDLGPGEVRGTVTIFDKQRTGVTANLGTEPVAFNQASFTLKLPAFGLNSIFVRYDSTITNAVSTSNTLPIQVYGLPGQLLIDQFRQSGVAGPLDQYVVLYNDTSIPMQLPGIVVEAPGGGSWTIPNTATTIGPRVGYLVAAPAYSTPNIPPDLTVPTLGPIPHSAATGLRLRVPDAASTITDAAGSTPGFFTGTALAAFTTPPTVANAWVRLRVSGTPQDTRDNQTDFRLVATVFGPINGVQSTLGSPSPQRQFGPFEQSNILQTTLADVTKPFDAVPNQEVIPATGTEPRQLVIRRAVTNRGVTPATLLRLRISTLSQVNPAPIPGRPFPPNPALLRLVNPPTPTSPITINGGNVVTVYNLSMDAPAADPPGGGLSTTLTVPLPIGGLVPGQTVYVALTFDVDQGGRFWVGWDVEAIGGGPVIPPSLTALTPDKMKTAAEAEQRAAKSRKLTSVGGDLR